MSDLPKVPWLRIRADADLQKIRKFVRHSPSNTYVGPWPDRNGNPIMSFGRDANPDSDWGKYQGHNGMIWFASDELAAKGEILVQAALQ